MDEMAWFKGKIAGTTHVSWENRWFRVCFSVNQSIELSISYEGNGNGWTWCIDVH